MKIRIKGDALRYRLTRSEVERFAQEGIFTDSIAIGGNTLTYALQRANQAELSALFKDNTIIVNVPSAIADEWTGTEKVGFSGIDGGLNLLIEKDFTCLDTVDEDQSDNYPNPLALNKHD